MKADPTGIPSEQIRFHFGWRRHDGADGKSCDTCLHCGWSEGARTPRRRCERMHLATQSRAVCEDWEARPAGPSEARRAEMAREEMAAIRRALADGTLPASDRGAYTARLVGLERAFPGAPASAGQGRERSDAAGSSVGTDADLGGSA